MKNKKISLLVLILSLSIFLTACTSQDADEGQLYDDVDIEEDGDIEEVDEEDEDIDINPGDDKYEYVDGEFDPVNFGTGQSIYIEQLEGRVQQAFTEIRRAAISGKNEVLLETVITDKDLLRIMNILLLDSPEVVGLSNNYSYKADNAGNVSMVKLKYFLTPEKITEAEKERIDVIKKTQNRYADEKTPKKEVIKEVLENKADSMEYSNFEKFQISDLNLNVLLDYYDDEKKQKEAEEKKASTKLRYDDIKDNFLDVLYSNNDKSRSKKEALTGVDLNSYKAYLNSDIAGIEELPLVKIKKKIAILRELGFNTSVVAGEFVGYDFIPDYDPLGVFDFVEAKKALKETEGENGYTDVYLDPFNYYFWMVVEVDNEYYIYDPELSKLINYNFKYELQDETFMGSEKKGMYYTENIDEFFPLEFYNLTPDYLISGSRIMYYNEDLLGVPPACRDDVLGEVKENNFFVDATSTSDLKTEAKNFVDEIIKTSATGDVVFKIFKDSKKLDEFALFFNEQFPEINDNNKNVIKEHDVMKIPILNMFVVYNILK